MRVLHVINYLSDGGGAEKLMEDLLPALKEKGVEVSIAVLRSLDTNNSRNLTKQGIKIIKIGKGIKLYSFRKMLRLISVMKDYDIVHSHLTAPFLFCAFDSIFAKVKLVTTIHNTDTRFRHYFGLRQLEKWAINKYDAIIACSNEAEDSLRRFLGHTSKNICTVSNGVKLDKFINAKYTPLVQDKNQRIITMVAVFRPQKDHDTLIKALCLLPMKFHVFFVGYGERLDAMKQYAEENGVGSRVHFLGKRTDVPGILKASDYVVLSSHYEGLSLSSIEGMAVGKPFIASDVPGLKELVGGYGELFEDGNDKQLADIILRLDNNQDEYDIVARMCSKRAASYDISNMADGYIKIYNQLLNCN